MSAQRTAEDLHQFVNSAFGDWAEMSDDYRHWAVARVETMEPGPRELMEVMIRALGPRLSDPPTGGE